MNLQNQNSESRFSKSKTECACNNTGITITYRQISILVAIVVFLLCSVFAAGYFWGARSVSQEFIDNLAQESLADQVYSSLYSMTDNEPVSENGAEDVSLDQLLVTPTENVVEQIPEVNMPSQPSVVPEAVAPDSMATAVATVPAMRYYAHLIGFPKRSAAQAFVDRVQKKGFNVVLKERISKTSKGKQTTWYQVDTPIFNSQTELDVFIQQVSRTEKLSGVRPISC